MASKAKELFAQVLDAWAAKVAAEKAWDDAQKEREAFVAASVSPVTARPLEEVVADIERLTDNHAVWNKVAVARRRLYEALRAFADALDPIGWARNWGPFTVDGHTIQCVKGVLQVDGEPIGTIE